MSGDLARQGHTRGSRLSLAAVAVQEEPDRLRQLTADEFERFIAERFERMGYRVERSGPTHQKDGGIDLIAVQRATIPALSLSQRK
ncbi:MAG: restriction endonuclease [Bryobacteraceae bacterium]|nr:restriction endonuclease [Bryobacteraceae bacterium]